ncbi:MAG: hypothetical protein ACLVJB_00055 [Christensenellales bacterium]
MEKRKINRFCEVTALVLALAALLTLIGTGLTERVHLGTWGGKTEAVVFLPMPAGRGAAAGRHAGRAGAVRSAETTCPFAGAGGALAAAAILAVISHEAGLRRGHRAGGRSCSRAAIMMSADYLNAYPYQLGICLPMEILLRLFPGLNLNLTMQLVNVAMALGAAAAMAALGRTIFEDSRISRACEAAGLLVWPALLFCQQVYGTIPMLFFVSLAMLCYAKYVKTRRRALGAAFACLLALAYAAKINAAVALIAVTICSVLDALENRKLEPLAYAALAIALSLLLLRAIIWQYERRSGVTLNSGIGALARLTMGMQEGGGAAGWFNRYTERFFPLEVTARQQHDIALADLKARLAEIAQNPAQTAAFFREKFCSQWMEPTMGMLWNGALSEHTGAFGETAARFFAKDHTALETLLGAFQRALYAFSAAGIIGMLRDRKRSGLCLLLPLIFFGGALYHLLFEAKSQYAFPYAVLLLPMAAMGICRIEDGLKGKRA